MMQNYCPQELAFASQSSGWDLPNSAFAAGATPSESLSRVHEAEGLMRPPNAPSSAYPFSHTQVGDAASPGNAGPDVSSSQPNIEPDAPRRIHRAEWEKHRKTIEAHHPFKTLTELRRTMAVKHGFVASTQQWKKKLAEWHLGKNIPPRLTKFIKKRTHSRRINKNKATEFTLFGKALPMDKIKRHVQGPQNHPPSPTGSTPTGVSYRTHQSPTVQFLNLPPPLDESKGKGQQAGTVSSLRMAFWQGRDADSFVDIARTAVSLSNDGDYLKAKPAFMEALEGLDALLTPFHALSIQALKAFVDEAVENNDFDTAIERLHKSYSDHQEVLGDNDKRTWRCLARLGTLYHQRGNVGTAYSMLFNAKQGLIETTTSDPEVTFHETYELTEEIIEVVRKQGDFEAAETEALRRISEAEALGEAYVSVVGLLKHNLVHLYHTHRFHPKNSVPRRKIEKLLQEITQTNLASIANDPFYICSWDQLRLHYHWTGQVDKLRMLLPSLENFVGGLGPKDCHTVNKTRELKLGLARSFFYLHEYDKAEWWLFHLQGEIYQWTNQGPQRPKNIEAIAVLIKVANLCFERGKRDHCKQMLMSAQQLAREMLPPNHTFHTVIADAVTSEKIEPVFKYDCAACIQRLTQPKWETDSEMDTDVPSSAGSAASIPDEWAGLSDAGVEDDMYAKG
ncbi:hypothetical protein N431DRAFT_68086 [Stipitochalara longipes BDJ]|nr:hypothetical protein N431DRAFT_68086 [Stipitochalara longipes BDJ]